MPIKGLQTDQPGLARAGIIRLGYKVKSCPQCRRQVRVNLDRCPACQANVAAQPQYPTEAPHFVLDDAPGLAEALGTDAPTELKIFFPFDGIDQVFPAYMQHFVASALTCRGDGERIVHAIDPLTGKTVARDGLALADFTEGREQFVAGQVLECPGLERNRYPKCAMCKPQALLLIMIRDTPQPRLAYWQISTTSSRNIRELTEQLNKVRQDIEQIIGVPKLTGVPFILKRVKRSISAPNLDRQGNPKVVNGKPQPRQRVDKYFLELEIDPEWVLKMFKAQRQLADPGRLALPARGTLDPAVPVAPATHAEPPVWEPAILDGDFEPAEEPTIQPADLYAPTVALVTETTIQVTSDKPANGHGRPFDPVPLKEMLDRIVAGSPFRDPETNEWLPVSLHPLGDKTANLVSKLFGSAFGGEETGALEMYHASLRWLTGAQSAKDLTAAQADALLYWLAGKENKKNLKLKELFKLTAVEPAPEEARRVHREALLAAGQQDLFTPEAE